jgi:uncharacterized protein YeaO (DUF488 family)
MRVYRQRVWQELPERTKRLLELASQKGVCLLCVEKDVRRCHRGIVGEFLQQQGWEVIDF